MNALGTEKFPLDNASIRVSAGNMPTKLDICFGRPYRQILRCATLATAMSCGLATTGCLSPLAKHAAAFSQATGIVIDRSEDAYRSAVQLHYDVQVAAAVYKYDKDPQWSPYSDMPPLLTPEQIDARITILNGLKAYAASLAELTGKPSAKDVAALDSASAGVGTNLQGLNQSIATDFSTVLPNAPVMSAGAPNGVSTAVLALGDYLIARKVKGSLRQVTQQMNPNVTALCELLDSDIKIFRRQADVDYQTLITEQNQSILHEGTVVNPFERRKEIGELIDLAARQKANDALLAKLQMALHTLALTHQALAAAAQGNNPESLKHKIAELEAAGQDLGNFYQSLPTS